MQITPIKQLFKLFLLSAFFALQSYAHAEIKVTYYIPDASGSPVAATDEQGKVLWRKHYKSFGEEIEQSEASRNNHIGYTGHVHDRSTGLTYMGARYYDPVVGRFMGMDPARVNPNDPRTFNRFAYANNSPYKYVDPDGRDAILPPNAWPQVSRDAPQAWNAIKEGTKGGLTAISFFAGGGAGLVGRTAAAGNTVRVGRWMGTAEVNAMKNTGVVQEGGGGLTFVSNSGVSSFKSQAKKGTSYFEFDVLKKNLLQAGKKDWLKTLGPNAPKSQLRMLEKQGGTTKPPFRNLSEKIESK